MTEQQIMVLVKEKMKSRPKIFQLFENCYQDTLEKTIRFQEDGQVFMLTGDIPAMWLRDSTNQLRPYLLTARDNERIQKIIEGVLKKQCRCILSDPYANAFNESANGKGHQTDETEMKPDIWERKYEVDSLCYPVQLAYLYWKNSGKTEHFSEEFERVMETVVNLWFLEQDHTARSHYTFRRRDCPESDTLPGEGAGNPVAVTGMTWSGFRPSDDRCVYGYLMPSNMFAVVVLGYMQQILHEFYANPTLEEKACLLRQQIEAGIRRYGMVQDDKYGTVYVYETDGMGHNTRMDDANVPSLLSMPYFHYCAKNDPVYQNTRRWVLSGENPFYYEGTAAKGVGSPHTPQGYIWHIALAIQGMTSENRREQERILDYFERTDGGTGLVHEGFEKDDPSQFTREWFSWSNAMFVEFVLSVCGLEIQTA